MLAEAEGGNGQPRSQRPKVFLPSPSSGERAQWVPLSLLFVCQRELTEFFAELTEFPQKLSELAPEQHSRNSIPPVSSKIQDPSLEKVKF